jgi:hypothetical protein
MIAFAHHDLLSAVGLDVLTTFGAKRSQKLLPRRERFIHRRSSRERESAGPSLSVHHERESGGCAVGKEALVPGRTKGKGSWAGGALGTPATVVAEPASVARRRSGDGRGAAARTPR